MSVFGAVDDHTLNLRLQSWRNHDPPALVAVSIFDVERAGTLIELLRHDLLVQERLATHLHLVHVAFSFVSFVVCVLKFRHQSELEAVDDCDNLVVLHAECGAE